MASGREEIASQSTEMYKEFAPGGQLYAERWMLNNFALNDFLLRVTVLCLPVHMRWKRGAQNAVIDSATDNGVLNLLE